MAQRTHDQYGIERLHEELEQKIKTQTALREDPAMLALLPPARFNMRKINSWQTLATKPIDQPIDLAA